ncbi:MAG: prephenate dehydratase [Candidatus Margulisbacteria bacterium]|nr:prephenate dehydratase [Candidatus Margulisiibacteriota bacterium]
MKIGFLGPEGTFCEEACNIYTKKLEQKGELIPYGTLYDLLHAVEKGKLSEAVVPIENSIEGTVSIVTDTLAKGVDLMIVQEVILPVTHNLIARKAVRLSEVTDVISHPQALDQCASFLRKKLPGAKLHFSHSTAEAVNQLAHSLGPQIFPHKKNCVFAAIGTASAARLYGLKILARDINARDNQTRFVVLSKKLHKSTGRDKTSIVVSMRRDMPGGLFSVLAEFADRKINLTKIESRPSKKALGDYYFFIDLEGHIKDKTVTDALKNVKKKTGFYKFLGSYPRK